MVARMGTVTVKRASGYNSIYGAALISAALIGSAAILSHFRTRSGERQEVRTVTVAEFDTVSIPVPDSPVPSGTRVRDIRLKSVAYPKDQLPAGAITDLGSYLEATTVAPLPANIPFFAENFSLTAGKGNPVIEQIPPGMRAITVNVDATAAVEGWAGSGTLVDVLLIEQDRTSVIAENVKILSTERSVAPVAGASSPNVPSTVTLLVSQEQALAINTAIPRGKIAFALRSLRDTDSWTSPVYTAAQLKGAPEIDRGRIMVNGYFSMRDSKGNRSASYALTNGKWTRSETVPEGFFQRQKEEER